MTPGSRWLLVCSNLSTAWEESGENPFVFCYLMMWGAAVVRDRTRP